jgi:hypothetical protein
MQENGKPRRGSPLGFGLVLIAVGLFFLVLNLRPGLDPWPFLFHYWPVILIVLGIAKLADVMLRKDGSPSRGPSVISAAVVLVVVLLLVFGMAKRGQADSTLEHETRSVEKQGATSVIATLDMPAGELNLNGGSSHLLDADFRYTRAEGEPHVDYDVSSGSGRLRITQNGGGVHMGNNENDWDLKLANDVPLELELKMGAGEGDLHMQGILLTRLQVQMGAGELNLDLTGERKQDLNATIHGGVGEATIRLPRDVGVQIRASGGIGSVEVSGLRQNGDEYVNDAYGKSPVTIRMTVEGGIGQINLIEEK